jgi:hypothetical protein
MSTSVETIRDRAAAALQLVDTLERGGVLGPAPAAALRDSFRGVLVPMSATSSPDVERAELDRLRMAVIGWRFLDNVDEYKREAKLYDLAGELVAHTPHLPPDAEMAAALGIEVDTDDEATR